MRCVCECPVAWYALCMRMPCCLVCGVYANALLLGMRCVCEWPFAWYAVCMRMAFTWYAVCMRMAFTWYAVCMPMAFSNCVPAHFNNIPIYFSNNVVNYRHYIGSAIFMATHILSSFSIKNQRNWKFIRWANSQWHYNNNQKHLFNMAPFIFSDRL